MLEKPYFKNLRHRNGIKTKKDRLVPEKIASPQSKKGWENVWMDMENKSIVFDNNSSVVNQIISKNKLHMIIPIVSPMKESDPIVSRFLAKASLEALVMIDAEYQEWVDEIIDKEELDPLRNYARYGKGELWIYNQRRIYSEEDRFCDPIHHPEPYEILHELDFLYIDNQILYFVLVIMGVEYVINLGASEIEVYKDWLSKNNNESPIRRYSEYMIKRKI